LPTTHQTGQINPEKDHRKGDAGGGSLNDNELGIVDDNEEIDPQNLLPALENTTTNTAAALENSTTTSDANGNVTATLMSMVTPWRRNELGSSSSVGSVMDMMLANMMERQQMEFCEHERQERVREQAFNERREERKVEQEERKSEQEECRLDREERRLDREQQQLDRAQQHQQTMMMMMAAFGGRMNNRESSRGGEDGGNATRLISRTKFSTTTNLAQQH
jgi:hypothetical protein